MTRPGILIYEDNNELRESLCSLILFCDKFSLAGNYGNVQQAEAQVRSIKPDIIIMDIDMPGVNGIEAVKKIRTFNRQVAIIMLTVFDDSRHVYDAICAGASGYLLKKHISDKLINSICEVLDGGAPMSPGIAKLVIQTMQQLPLLDQNKYKLTPKEKEILTSLSKGNSFKLIAVEHDISIDTVRTHIKKIYEKLNVHSQTEAAYKAVNEHLV